MALACFHFDLHTSSGSKRITLINPVSLPSKRSYERFFFLLRNHLKIGACVQRETEGSCIGSRLGKRTCAQCLLCVPAVSKGAFPDYDLKPLMKMLFCIGVQSTDHLACKIAPITAFEMKIDRGEGDSIRSIPQIYQSDTFFAFPIAFITLQKHVFLVFYM